MKKMFAVAVLLAAAGCGGLDGKDCDAGAMRCSGTVAQMCSAEGHWEAWQDCRYSAFGATCYTTPAHCSGYAGIACCD